MTQSFGKLCLHANICVECRVAITRGTTNSSHATACMSVGGVPSERQKKSKTAVQLSAWEPMEYNMWTVELLQNAKYGMKI